MDVKRTILAVVLSMAVLIVFQNYLAPPPPAPAPERAAPAAVAATPAAPPGVLAAAPGDPSAGAPPERQLPVVRAVLANNRVEVDLTSRGGAVVRARLRDYTDRAGAEGRPLELLAGPSGFDLAGATRLVNGGQGLGAVYEETGRSATQVSYAWTGPSGLRIEKTYALQADRYDLALTVRVVNGTGEAVRDRLGLQMVQDLGAHEDSYSFTGPAYLKGGKFEEVKVKALKDGVQDSGPVGWAALLEKYFLVAVIPQSAEGQGLRLGTHLGMEKVAEAELLGPPFELGPGAEATFGYQLYLGPKRTSDLVALGPDAAHLVDYGFFDMLAKPLLWFLNFIYGVLGNYGIAIIVLTTVIKGVFWPLSARSFKSMQRMKELQPKMAKLKERHGNDRERLNMEVMQLYKTHKVNPLGGCLPMLVQIPFFFALYKILLDSIELRHAPFFLWIQDLSAKDPYYITPLLMGASMFLQQKMTPVTGGNEAQMKMMMYGMPVIFTFMFLNFPSGLVIYWLVNNVLSIAQQGMMLRQGGSKAAA